MPFLYESTGVITRFTDARDPKPRSREVFNFHRPETLKEWLTQGASLRERLQYIPPLNPNQRQAMELRLRNCQEIAITNLETSFKADRPRALIQMATGAGKTYTAITSTIACSNTRTASACCFWWTPKTLANKPNRK